MNFDKNKFVRASELLSKSEIRLKVFKGIYEGKKTIKTVVELEKSLDLNKKAVLGAGRYLVDHGLAMQGKSKVDGKVTTHYEKIPNISVKKASILRLAKNKPRLKKELNSLNQPQTRILVEKAKTRSRIVTAIPVSILRVSASPTGQNPVRADREFAEIENAIERSKFKSRIKFLTKNAVTTEELQNAFNESQPDIFHFSGHSNEEALLLDDGSAIGCSGKTLTYEILARLINSTSKQPDIVFLNSCFSTHAANNLLDACKVVVGMNDTIGYDAASAFAKRFYAGIANGETVGNSIEQGKIALAIDYPESENLIDVSYNNESNLDLSY